MSLGSNERIDDYYLDCDASDNSSSYSANEDDEEEIVCDDDDGIVIETQNVRNSRSEVDVDYEVLDVDQVKHEMDIAINDVAAIIHYPRTICRLLLHHHKWNKDSLLEQFFEDTNTEEFFRKANIYYESGSFPRKESLRDTVEMCEICCNCSILTGLECDHKFCMNCWDAYLSSRIMNDGHAYIPCPQQGCSVIADDEKTLALIKKEEVRKSYRHHIISSFVQCNRLLRWCPATDCGRVLKVSHSSAQPVKCKCGHTCCFSCGHEWHEPVNCRLLKLWLKKCSDDSETSNWLSANTKECPKCQVTIEKDGGCNHMTCRNSSCKMEFCWMCLGPWEPHGSSWYSCNRYDDTLAKQARDAQEKSRAALQRYLHYYNRFMNHQQSLRFEHRLYSTVKGKMETMQQANMSWIEVQFLRTAVDVLSECRRTLMYTYAFAFYLVKDNQSTIFEDNQRDLEHATEQLSEFLERDLEQENLVSLKQKVQDKYRYVEQRRTTLLRHCAEGFEKGFWNFTK